MGLLREQGSLSGESRDCFHSFSKLLTGVSHESECVKHKGHDKKREKIKSLHMNILLSLINNHYVSDIFKVLY